MKPSSEAEVVAVTCANNKYASHFTGDLFGGSRLFLCWLGFECLCVFVACCQILLQRLCVFQQGVRNGYVFMHDGAVSCKHLRLVFLEELFALFFRQSDS